MSEKKRILTGDRTTGKLHLGHYVGSLQNRVRLQDEYESFILLADIQALTTHFEHPELLEHSIYEVAMDNLSVGLDPNKITLVQQSRIPSIGELTVFYSMLVSVNSLRHNPTIKTEAANYGYNDMTYGFLGYPVSQSADITFCKANLVPVGEDQKPHMEMGKSLGNAIYLSDPAEEVRKKVMSAVTDASRIKKDDPGHPDICVVSKYHKVFNAGEYENICESCKKGAIGCVACKKALAASLNDLLEPFREKRAYYEAHRDEVRDIILTGSEKANKIGNETVKEVKEAMHIYIGD